MKVFHVQRCAILWLSAAVGWAAAPPVTVPLSFEPNVGQTDAQVKYLARHNDATLWLTGEGPVLGIGRKSGGSYLKLRFEGGKRAPAMQAEEQRPGVSNYFLGSDPHKWRTDVPNFGKVRYREVYPGIDAVFYGNPDQLEYDLVVQPGADPSHIRIVFDGASRVSTNAKGELVIQAGSAEIRALKPVIRQGSKIVGGHYVIHGKRSAGFAVEAYDRSETLTIDPIVTYASYIGGNIGDQGYGVAIDKQGNIYVTGETSSLNFPTKNAFATSLPATLNNPTHAFVTKINPSASGGASLVYSTLYGSDGSDSASAIAVDSTGAVVITGSTGSFDSSLPQVNAFETPPTKSNTCGSVQNAAFCLSAFAAKLSSTGNTLVYSSYLSGTAGDGGTAATFDASGNAWIAGFTTSLDFPTRGQAYQTSLRGNQAGFLSEITPTGSLVYSTYFAAPPAVEFSAVTTDGSGNVIAAGSATATSLPTTPGAYQTAYPGATAAVVVKLSPSAGLLYCTYLGGTTGTTSASGVAVDAAGNIYVAGGTYSTSFPVTAGAFQTTLSDQINFSLASDGFVTKLNPAAQGNAQLVYSTLLGGSFDDTITAIASDSAGHLTIAGVTNSFDFPVTLDAFECCWSGQVSSGFITNYGFVTRMDLTKSGSGALVYGTLLGGTLFTALYSVALDSTGNIAAVAGLAESTDTPVTPSAFQSVFGGQATNSVYPTDFGDAYVARFDFSQTGPAAFLFENGAGLAALSGANIAPGLIFTLKGTGLGPSVFSLAQIDPSTGLISTNVAGVQVFVNGIACALTYVSATQINAIAPYELANQVGQFARIQVFYDGVPGSVLRTTIAATAPGILSLDDGSGQGVIVNQDSSLNGPNNPAAVGTIITIYATGEGQTNPPGIDGGIANDFNHLPHPVGAVAVSIGTVNAPNIAYAGTAPAEIYGLFQINVTIPPGVSPGSAVPVVVTVGGVASQKGLTMAVK